MASSDPIVERVSRILRENQYDEYADDLDRLIHQLASESPEVARNAALEIAGRCHPKAWGDKYIETLEYAEWVNLLSKLAQKMRSLANKLSRNNL